MRQYLFYSSSAHFLLAALLFIVIPKGPPQKAKQYYIDFIGQARVETVQNSVPEASKGLPKETLKTEKKNKQTAPKTEADFDKDDFFKDSQPLKPSLAGESSRLLENAGPDAVRGGGETAPGGESAINTDSDFPYPWYITQLREILWDSWRKRMPTSNTLKCSVMFRILRNGDISEVELESSSGNRLFDHAAVSSVESSEKFPALPDDFFENSLVIHVEFKNMGI